MSILCSCGGRARLVKGLVIYPHRPDLSDKKFYLCVCGNYVGCHPGTTKATGTPADAHTRTARSQLHTVFDQIWRDGQMTRNRAYKWLAEAMELSRFNCHIGKFTLEQCNKAMEIIRGKK